MSHQLSQQNNWVSSFINSLENTEANGGQIQLKDGPMITLSKELIKLIIQNRYQLEKVGENAFKQFLAKMSIGYSFEALVAIYSQLDNSALIEAYKTDTVKLAEIALQAQQDRDFWIDFAKQVGSKLVSVALGTLL